MTGSYPAHSAAWLCHPALRIVDIAGGVPFGRVEQPRDQHHQQLTLGRREVVAQLSSRLTTTRMCALGSVSKSGLKPFIDHGDGESGFMAAGGLVVAGSHGAVAFAPVDAALHGRGRLAP
jgi:hypothetical protein